VNVASMAGLLDVPMMSSYNVSKAGVVSLSETLQIELADDNIAVSVVCPSFFRTNLGESMRASNPRFTQRMNKLFEKSPMSADDVAETVFKAVKSRTFHVLPHRNARPIWLLKRFLPRPLYAELIKRNTRRMR
jgi:short-subunit dehydrogenase